MTSPTPPPNPTESGLRAPRDAAAEEQLMAWLRAEHRHSSFSRSSGGKVSIDEGPLRRLLAERDELLRLRAAASAEGAANQWMSVGERLPEREGYYLVVWRNANQHVRSDYFNGFTFPYDEFGRTTHWRPLPPPPAALSQVTTLSAGKAGAQPDGGEGERE